MNDTNQTPAEKEQLKELKHPKVNFTSTNLYCPHCKAKEVYRREEQHLSLSHDYYCVACGTSFRYSPNTMTSTRVQELAWCLEGLSRQTPKP